MSTVMRQAIRAVVILGLVSVGGSPLAHAEPSYTIRWAQIHLPSSAADRAAFEFAAQVEEETGGDVVVKVHTRKEYEAVAGKRRNAVQITKDVAKGELEMTQSYTHVLARYNQRLRVLGMPYLFRDYGHAEQVFASNLGKKFVDNLEETSNLKGFGIAYSGGMGVISTKDVIARDPAALDDMRILISRGRYARMALYLGGTYVVVGPDGLVPLAQAGLVDAAETTVACFDVYQDYLVNNVVNETHHFLLTSMVVINKEFFASLPEAYQEIVSRVAKETVVRERKWSIEATVDSRRKLEGQGITFVDLTQEEKDAYKVVLEPLYGALLSTPEIALAKKIRAMGDGAPAPANAPALATAPAETGTAAGAAEPRGGCATGPTPAKLSLSLLALSLLLGRRREAGRCGMPGR